MATDPGDARPTRDLGGWAERPGGEPRWPVGDDELQPRSTRSTAATLSGVLLLLLGGGIAALMGASATAVRAALNGDQQALTQFEQAGLPRESLTSIAPAIETMATALVVYALLSALAFLGIMLRRPWGRLLGMVLGGVGLSLGILTTFASPVIGVPVAAGYLFAFVTLIGRRDHFRRERPRGV